MNCQKMKKLIESYLEGNLDSKQHQNLQAHLKDCSSCRKEFENCQKLETVLREAFTFEQSNQRATESVMAGISSFSAQGSSKTIVSFGKIAAGILLITGLAVGFYAGRQSVQKSFNNLPLTSYQVSQLKGTVLVRHEKSDLWTPLQTDSKIYAGDQFLSTPEGSVRFKVDADSYVELFENSMLVLQITEDQTDLYLMRGMLDASLKSPHGPFFVTTPHGRAEALGTEFSVTVK